MEATGVGTVGTPVTPGTVGTAGTAGTGTEGTEGTADLCGVPGVAAPGDVTPARPISIAAITAAATPAPTRCRALARVREERLTMGKSWGLPRPTLGTTGKKMGTTGGFRERSLTLVDGKRNLSTVRRQKPAEPQRNTARWEEGKPEGTPQGSTEGGREKAARLDRGSALSPARGSRSERVEIFGRGCSVLRNGDFPGVAGPGSGWGCPTRSQQGAGGAL
jgi:hypothetical protein